MNILFAASEAVPFAKTGGLADVAGALPRAVADLDHHVTVVMPCYASCRRHRTDPTDLTVQVRVHRKVVVGQVFQAKLPGSDVITYLIAQPDYFDRPGCYGEHGREYNDNCERFVFFSRAVMELVCQLGQHWDILHANDWQTALVPVYLSELYRRRPGLAGARTLFTVHNLAYQGSFWHWDMLLTGLDWRLFNWRQLEFHGKLNLLKAGLVFADAISTVSPTYAREVQTPEHGCGLESVLRWRRDRLYGILNGIDYAVWNPATDRHIAHRYDADSFAVGKGRCKAALQQQQGLPQRPDVPLLGMISRLEDQKGLDLLAEAADPLLRRQLQIVVLGTGQTKYHELLERLKCRFPDKLAVNLAFDEVLAHRIQAGADLLLMPSRYEPCGLSQLVALKYGTIPLVRATGGLADTIVDCTAESLAAGTANGFSFRAYTPEALMSCLGRALELWPQRDCWARLVRTAMAQDWSWKRSAQQYVELYERLRSEPPFTASMQP